MASPTETSRPFHSSTTSSEFEDAKLFEYKLPMIWYRIRANRCVETHPPLSLEEGIESTKIHRISSTAQRRRGIPIHATLPLAASCDFRCRFAGRLSHFGGRQKSLAHYGSI